MNEQYEMDMALADEPREHIPECHPSIGCTLCHPEQYYHPCVCGGTLECRDELCDTDIQVHGCQSCMGEGYYDHSHGEKP